MVTGNCGSMSVCVCECLCVWPAIQPGNVHTYVCVPLPDIWQIFQVVKRISGTFGWLCHDDATSPHSHPAPSATASYRLHIAHATYAAYAAAN